MRQIVCLKYHDYEMEVNHFLLSPENPEVEFKTLCDSLLDEAVEKVCQKCKDEKPFGFFVGWMNIVETLADILVSQGYEKTIIPTVDYFGATIISNKLDNLKYDNQICDHIKQMSEKSLNTILEHNDLIRKRLDEYSKKEST